MGTIQINIMKFKNKLRIQCKVGAFALLIVNDLLMWFFILCTNYSDEHLLMCIASVFALVFLAASEIWGDVCVRDYSTLSIVLDYIGASFASAVFAYIGYVKSNVIATISIIIALIVENCIVIFLYYRHKKKLKRSIKTHKA